MPRGYDAGALIAELERLNLFAIEHSDDGAMLVPAVYASASPEAARTDARVTLSVKVPVDVAAHARALSDIRGRDRVVGHSCGSHRMPSNSLIISVSICSRRAAAIIRGN